MASGRRSRFAGRLARPSGPKGKIGMYSYFTMQRLGNMPIFQANLLSDIRLQIGIGTPPFTRATIATVTDWESIVRTVLSGEVRFQGARRVRNFCISSEDSTGWVRIGFGTGTAPTTTNGFTDPLGGNKAIRIVATLNGGTTGGDASYIDFANSFFGTPVQSVWIKNNGGAGTRVLLRQDTASESYVISITNTWTIYSVASAVILGLGSNAIFTIGLRGNVTALNPLDILVYHPQAEDVTGQSNTNPAEDVSVGVLAAPYHGANVDGVKYFPWQNGNTVASNVVTKAVGAAIGSTILLGYLAEGARTNEVLFSRDLTNAAWVKVTTTVALDQTGVDGAANAASSLLATGANATVLQAIVEAASTREFSAYVKRITGAGEIDMTEDGGLTWTNITGSINSSTYSRVQIPSQSFLNPNVGFRIVTNGDKIAVDMVQNELGAFMSSAVPTTTVAVTRNADVLTYPSAGNIDFTVGTGYAEITVLGNSADTRVLSGTAGVQGGPILLNGTSQPRIYDETTYASSGLGNIPLNTVAKVAGSYGASTMKVFLNGVAGNSQAFDGILSSGNIQIMGTAGQTTFGTIRNVKIWGTQLPDTSLQALTQ